VADTQDVDRWVSELRAAGWLPWDALHGRERPGSTTWRSPSGAFYRGPYGAWCVMRALAREEG
jgi:hypothetical protein